MKKVSKIILVALTVALLISCISVYANGGWGRVKFTKEQREAVVERFSDCLDEMVDEKVITEEQAEYIEKEMSRAPKRAFGMKKMPEFNGKPNETFKENRENFKRHEMSEEQKEKMMENHKNMLKKQLEEGKLTDDEYNEAISNLENGKMPFMRGPMDRKNQNK